MFSLSIGHAKMPKGKQTGLTLVELLVASTLGLIFITAMIRVYLDAKQSYTLNAAKTVLHEDSRAAFRIMALTVAQAGYRNGRNLRQESQSLFPSDGPFNTDQIISAQGDTDGNWQLTTRFQGNDDGLVSDCLGNRYSDQHLVTQVLRYEPSSQRLSCTVRCTTPRPNNLTCPEQSAVISNNLRALELLIGLEGQETDRTPEQYQNIENFTGTEKDILAIKALGWFESKQNVRQIEAEQTLAAYTGTLTETDRKLRLAFSETFTVRNRLP